MASGAQSLPAKACSAFQRLLDSGAIGRAEALRLANLCPSLVSRLLPLTRADLDSILSQGYDRLLSAAAAKKALNDVEARVLFPVLERGDFARADWLVSNATFDVNPILYLLRGRIWTDSPKHAEQEIYLSPEITAWLGAHFGAPDAMSKEWCAIFQGNLADYFNLDEPDGEVGRWLVAQSRCFERFEPDYPTIVGSPRLLDWLIGEGNVDPRDGELLDAASDDLRENLAFEAFLQHRAPQLANLSAEARLAEFHELFLPEWNATAEDLNSTFASYHEWFQEGGSGPKQSYYNPMDALRIIIKEAHYGPEIMGRILLRVLDMSEDLVKDALF